MTVDPTQPTFDLAAIAKNIPMCMKKDPKTGTPCIRRAEVCYELSIISSGESKVVVYMWLCSKDDINVADMTVTFTRSTVDALMKKAAAQGGLITA